MFLTAFPEACGNAGRRRKDSLVSRVGWQQLCLRYRIVRRWGHGTVL